jgi:hypothetical protein
MQGCSLQSLPPATLSIGDSERDATADLSVPSAASIDDKIQGSTQHQVAVGSVAPNHRHAPILPANTVINPDSPAMEPA